MLKNRIPVALALLLTISVTLMVPVTPAYAFSIADILPQNSSQDTASSGGSGILNVLLGLLLGKLLGNVMDGNTNNAVSGLGKVLGWSDNSPAVSVTGVSAIGSAVVATAQKYMGVPYVWGGETPSGFDCSGFTQYVLKQHGITIPRTAAEQFAAGKPVDKSQLKVGDLVFFTTYKAGASHVGFYLGGGKFVHASSAAEKVAISDLSEKYYTDRYIGARSFIP